MKKIIALCVLSTAVSAFAGPTIHCPEMFHCDGIMSCDLVNTDFRLFGNLAAGDYTFKQANYTSNTANPTVMCVYGSKEKNTAGLIAASLMAPEASNGNWQQFAAGMQCRASAEACSLTRTAARAK